MRPAGRGLFALLVMLTAPPAAHAAGPQSAASQDWPAALPVDEMLSSWWSFSGGYTVELRRVSYQLYVDPARPGLYRVTRYSISPLPGATGEDALAMETVQFNALPGRETPSCYQRRVAADSPRPWLALSRGTQPYKDEMVRGIEVYIRHRATMP